MGGLRCVGWISLLWGNISEEGYIYDAGVFGYFEFCFFWKGMRQDLVGFTTLD